MPFHKKVASFGKKTFGKAKSTVRKIGKGASKKLTSFKNIANRVDKLTGGKLGDAIRSNPYGVAALTAFNVAERGLAGDAKGAAMALLKNNPTFRKAQDAIAVGKGAVSGFKKGGVKGALVGGGKVVAKQQFGAELAQANRAIKIGKAAQKGGKRGGFLGAIKAGGMEAGKNDPRFKLAKSAVSTGKNLTTAKGRKKELKKQQQAIEKKIKADMKKALSAEAKKQVKKRMK